MVIKFLKSLNEGHLWFLDFKKVEIIEKADALMRTFSQINYHLIEIESE